VSDYSQFPFDNYSQNELGLMLMQAIACGDREFADVVREQVRQRKPEKETYAPDEMAIFKARLTGEINAPEK
jgi:hypothetical protein